jgi:integrase
MSRVYVNPSDHHVKPSKPYDEFPLFAHDNGCWAKKIRGQLHYFGAWTTNDPDRGADAALAKYLAEKDDLHAGRKPRSDPAASTVKDVCNAFLNRKQALLDAGELSPRTWQGYKLACDTLIDTFGKGRLAADLGPDDFARLRDRLAQRYGPHGLGTQIQCVRCCFKYAFEAGHLPTPVRYGPNFNRPSKKTMRLHRAAQGPKLFTPEEVRRLIDAATTQHKAMVLLGINAGFGNNDCAALPLAAVDLETGWIDYPRPRTGLTRRVPLWPETVAALRVVLADRKKPKDKEHAGLVFITRTGQPWGKDTAENPLSDLTSKLRRRLGINGRKGLGFYGLRHTFRTVADEVKDQPAADFIMGHEVSHMSTVYRERIGDDRLRAVVDHVRAWLFEVRKEKGKGEKAPADADSTGTAVE